MNTLSKSFSPTTITDGGITQLTFTVIVDDGVGGPIVFNDTLPLGLVYAGNPIIPPLFIGAVTTPAIGTHGTISVARPAVPNGTYVFIFDITNAVGQTNPSCLLNPSAFTNSNSNLSGLFNVTFDGIPSCLVVADLVPAMELIVTKSFSPSSILIGGVSTLTITITNPNPFPVAGVAFNDVYPSGVVNASPTNYVSGDNVLPPPTSGSNNLAFLKVIGIPALGSVTISVDVTSNTVGVYNNSTGVVTNLEEPPVPPSAGASATLTVQKLNPKRRSGSGGIGLFVPPNTICVVNNGKNEERVSYYGYIYIFYRKDTRGNWCYLRTTQRAK